MSDLPSNSFCWYIRNFTAEAILFHIYYRKIDASFSNVKYTVFRIPWGNVSIEMFQSETQKIHYSCWKPVTVFWYVKYRFSCSLHINLHSDFHNCNIENFIFHVVKSVHIWYTMNFISQVGKSFPSFFYVNYGEFHISCSKIFT